MEAGLTKGIGYIYLILFSTIFSAALLNVSVAGIQLNRAYDTWLPLILMAISIGVIRKTRWGRWLAYPVSIFLLIGVPIGTVLGGFMIWHLTKYRTAFSKWY